MNRKKIFLYIFGFIGTCFLLFFLGSLGIMILVNSGFTNESSGKGGEVSLVEEGELDKLFQDKLNNVKTKSKFQGFEWFNQQKDFEEQIKKYSISDIGYSWIKKDMSEIVNEKKGIQKLEEKKNDLALLDDNLKRVYTCLNEGLVYIDSFFTNAEMSFEEIYEISTHIGYIVPSFSVYKNYCAQDPNGAIEKKEEIVKPGKFKDMIIKDLYEGPITQFIKNFMNDEKNKKELKQIADLLKIDERIIMSIVLVEQLRAAETDRDRVKKLAEKSLLNSFTMFSLGISGMKVSTANKIEGFLKNSSSEFYLGKDYESILNFDTKDIGNERYKRLTSNDTYYWQYLYTGISIKMFQKQWADKGFNIDDKAGIIGTLYNLGFEKSKPKQSPSLGGANISYLGNSYLFGELSEKNFIFLITRLKKT